VPVTVVGDQVVVGYNRPALASMLKLESVEKTPVDGALLLRRYQKVFRAFSRAARQVPDDKLLAWKSPERDRNLRQFLFHVYDRPDLMLQGCRTGVYRYEDVLKAYERAEAYTTTSALVDRGDALMAGVYDFLRTATPEALAQPITSYQGVLGIGDLLTLALAHGAHHLRQLYHYFGIMGITPQAPLGDRDFEGIPLPTKLF
jgi:hypothetical protein